MPKRPFFIPGLPAASDPPLVAYRPPQPVGAAREYVRRLTARNGLVVDLFCQGPRFVGEALEVGRRVLGFSVNPLLLHAARLGLAPLDQEALRVGFTQLADSPRADEPLGSYLPSLYRARCPACQTTGTAEWFAWRRDVDRPFEKAVRCSRCGGVRTGPTDRDDVALAQSFASRGLPYYYALDRAAPLTRQARHPARERAADLVSCYTPRNLSALMDLSRRVAGMKAAQSVRIGLMALLLDCFDRCSKLYPYGEDRARPRTLRIPVRYLERNVWLCLEEGLSSLLQRPISASVPETEDVTGLIQGDADGYALVASAARDIGEILPIRSVDLVLVDPPRPDGAFWALSALWVAWLWTASDARAMRPFLRRRRFDWHWHWQALREALRTVGPRLTDTGFLAMLFSEADPAMLRSVCLAATGAGYCLRAWGYAPEVGYRLAWRWEGSDRSELTAVEGLETDAAHEAEGATSSALRHRGEPSSKLLLHAAAYARLVDRGLMRPITALGQGVSPMDVVADAIDRGFATAPIVELVQGAKQRPRPWWLLDPPETEETLADQVELLVRQMLAERLVWLEDDLINAVYARCRGMLTPDLTLVSVCVASYGLRDGREIRLRPEDDFERRRDEIEVIGKDLAALGQRLGFQASHDNVWDMRWLDSKDHEDGHTEQIYVFAISATAALASRLLGEAAPDSGAQRCLVVPGGRAGLIDLKLQRDPRLAQAVDSGRWQFIKFRHLRRLVAEEDLDRYAFKSVLGLDPIAEREHTQLLLF